MTQPLTDAINALTRYANETTGQSDTNLSDAVRTLCDGYGGGGATPFELLEEITLTEAVRAVNFDTSQWSDYDYLVCFCNVTIQGGDWIYVVANGTTGGTYTGLVSSYNTVLWEWLSKLYGDISNFARTGNNNVWTSSRVDSLENVYVYLYTSSKTFDVGSKFKVYGIKYADL